VSDEKKQGFVDKLKSAIWRWLASPLKKDVAGLMWRVPKGIYILVIFFVYVAVFVPGSPQPQVAEEASGQTNVAEAAPTTAPKAEPATPVAATKAPETKVKTKAPEPKPAATEAPVAKAAPKATKAPPKATKAPPKQSACEQRMKVAHGVDEMKEKISDLFPAALACSSVEEWVAASDKYPNALDGVNPEQFLRNICTYNAEIKESQLCVIALKDGLYPDNP